MTPIEYIDLMAYNTRVYIESKRSTDADVSHEIWLADSMEKSAEWFREQDPTLPPPKKREDPAVLFSGGHSRPITARPASYFS